MRPDGKRYPAGNALQICRSDRRIFCWRKALRNRQPPIFIAHRACCRAQKRLALGRKRKPAGNDLPPGAARLKQGGGHGGHNGVRDVIACLGTGFWRLRIGVGHPGDKDKVIGAVLGRASTAEQQLIDAALARALAALPVLLNEGAQKAMNSLHTSEDA